MTEDEIEATVNFPSCGIQTEDPAIEAMCRALNSEWPLRGPIHEVNEAAMNARRNFLRSARAAIPIGSEWTTPEGVRVIVVPVENATWAVLEDVSLKDMVLTRPAKAPINVRDKQP